MSIKIIFTSIVLAFILLSAPAVLAASYMKLGAIYMADDDNGDSRNRLVLDLAGGWIASNGFTAGFLYASEKNTVTNGVSADRTSFGPSLGYASKKEEGWYIIGTYFLSSTTTNELKGSGNQIDAGYKFLINKVSFAPQLSKKQFTYTSQYGNDLSPTYSVNRIDPCFVVWIDF